jgi:hypothetical protein
MLRQGQINAASSAGRLRSALSAAAAPLRRASWAAEDRLWSAGALLGHVADAARWPFERLAWTVERRLVWPLRERTAGWDPPLRVAGAGALAAVAIAAVLAGLLLSGESGKSEVGRVAAPVRVAIAPPPAKPVANQRKGPLLQGASPSFGVGKGVGVAKQADGNSSDATATGSAAPRASTLESDEGDGGASASAEGAATASSSTAKPVPAGPAAMKVARRFAKAFVFYEIGKRPARSKAVFGETATPQLAEALAERPPRLPENARVPKARVVNLVPGPRRGRAYTVSASLLRVGLTSELRLEMRKQQGAWLVTDVRG